MMNNANKPATPQIEALPGMTPLGFTPPRKDARPDDIALDASKASDRGDHRDAERLYLLAAARASTYTKAPTMRKNMQHWDKCASRERRLAELTKK
jgi:hypothetical protein